MAKSRFLSSKLTIETLLSNAGNQAFARGEKYQRAGHVEDLRQHGDRISAMVQGNDAYSTSIKASATSLVFSCTCPVGLDEAFCKHCVALGLEWLEQVEGGDVEGDDAIRDHLNNLDKSALIDILLEHCLADSNLQRKLEISSAASTKDPALLKKAIDRALKSRKFVNYSRMPTYVRAASEVIDQIENVLAEGNASHAIELSERALQAVEHTLGGCDDSDGYMGEILRRLQDIHLEACEELKPEPVSLAKRLFEWEIQSDWEVFYGAAHSYRQVLGEHGLAEYHRRAMALWTSMPALTAGDKDPYDSQRFRLTGMMEALAEATENLEELADIRKRDLSSAYKYLGLAQVFVRMGRRDLALEWAQNGIDAFPQQPDDRLYAFLADHLEQVGDEYRSMEIEWRLFSTNPGFRFFPALKERAERLHKWELWRPKAIGAIRQAISERKGQNMTYFRSDSSDLVSIYLFEGDADAAWDEARQGGCSDHLLLQVAEKREKLHPEDSIPIYKAHVERLVRTANNSSYEQAASYVVRVGNLAQPAEYDEFVLSLRTRHKAKRNFMKLLGSVHKPA